MTEGILTEFTKPCASKSNFNSPLKLSRDSSIPVFDRNSLELNLSTEMSSLKYNLKMRAATLPNGKPDTTKNILYFNVGDNSSVVSFNNREYVLKKMILFSQSIHSLTSGNTTVDIIDEKNIMTGGKYEIKNQLNKPTDVGLTTALNKVGKIFTATKNGTGTSKNCCKIITDTPYAPLELVLQFETSGKKPDYLNMCIFVKPGSKFDNSSTFFNQLLFKVNSSTPPSKKLNLYDVLPKNRSYFSYTGPWIEKPKINNNCFSKNDNQWVIYENSINIDTAEYDNLKNKLKVGKLGTAAYERNISLSQYVYYKSDKDATLAGMESGDIKYVKCSRKLMNEDPDAYRKYLYRRKSKNRKCDNILNMNKNLEKTFDQEINKLADEDTLLGQINKIFDNKEDMILNILTSTLMLIALFIMAYISIFCIIYIVKYIKDNRLSTSPSMTVEPSAPAAA